MLQAIIAGNIGKDAEIRDTKGGSVVSFSVASESRVKGEKVTTWVRVSIWGKRAEALHQHLTKGSKVTATGALSTREHDGKTYLELNCSDIELMGKPAGASGGGGRAPAASANADDYDASVPADDIPF